MKPIVEMKIEKDRKQNTIILMWNPSISSYTVDRFESDLLDMAEVGLQMSLIGASGSMIWLGMEINS